MDVGASKAGVHILAASEIEPNACETYRINHPGTEMIEGDINETIQKFSKYKDANIDFVMGGPPCQGFSVAGKMDINDPRSQLIFSFCDVVEMVRPKAFIMENVKALGALEKFSHIRNELIKRMQYAGYSIQTHILNAKDFGVPQSRERFFIIGTLPQYHPVEAANFEHYKCEAPSLRKAIFHLGRAGSETNPNITKAKITLAEKPVLRKSPYAGMLFNGQGRPLNPDAWSSTLPASMGGNRTPIIDEDHLYEDKPSWVENYHHQIMNGSIQPKYGLAPKRLRRLTVEEAAILQSFPVEYVFYGAQTKKFSQIGNAVPCKLAEAVISASISSLGVNVHKKCA